MTSARDSDDEIRRRHLRTIAAFVVRARRIEAHSWAADKPALLARANGTLNCTRHPDGKYILHVDLPPEELVESMAARVRPLILKKDMVHGLRVIKAINYFARSDDVPTDVREGLESERRAWKSFDDKSRDLRGYELHFVNTATGESGAISDNALAFAWIYGDTVHADSARLKEAAIYGVDARYEAAVALVAQVAVHAIATLNAVRALVESGHIELSAELFERPVVVVETTRETEVALFSAPVGTALPTDPTASPDGQDGWVRHA